MRAAHSQLSAPASGVRAVLRYLPGVVVCLGVATLIALPSPAVAAWLLLGGVAFVAGIVRPDVVCYLLLPAVAIGTTFTLPAGPLRVGPTDLLVGALVLGWVIRQVAQRPAPGMRRAVAAAARARSIVRAFWRREPGNAALVVALITYLAVIVITFLVASNRAAVLKETLKWAEVLVVLVLGAHALSTPGRRWTAVWMMVAVGVVEGLLGYVQWVMTAGDLGQNGSGIRVFGTFDQPNPYAAYLNLSLLIVLAIALFGRGPRVRWLAAGSTALMAGAQFLAGSRGGWLALVAGVALVVVVGLGIERITAALSGLAALVAGLAWAVGIVPVTVRNLVLGRLHLAGVSLDGPVNDANFSSIERLAHWVAGVRMFLAHPLLGVGAGNYDVAYLRYAVRNWPDALGHAHNYYINAAAETGICGLIAFLAVTGTMLFAAWRAVRPVTESPNAADPGARTRAPGWRERWLGRFVRGGTSAGELVAPDAANRHALALGLLGVVGAVAIHSLVDDVFVHGMELQLALCLALAVTLGAHVPSRSTRL